MSSAILLLGDILNSDNNCNFTQFSEAIDSSLHAGGCKKVDEKRIELDVIEEILDFAFTRGDVDVFVNADLREVKLKVYRDFSKWQYCLIAKVKSSYKLKSHSLPEISELSNQFLSLHDVLNTFDECLLNLEEYFKAMADIDECFLVLDPPKPTAKDNFRRIAISDSVSAIITLECCTSAGAVPRVRLVGPKKAREPFEELLQNKLTEWNTDDGIAVNLLRIFGIGIQVNECKMPETVSIRDAHNSECAICLSDDPPAMPLCDNPKCRMHFHQECLYQWLVAANPSSVRWGDATGKCPNCLMSITCPKST